MQRNCPRSSSVDIARCDMLTGVSKMRKRSFCKMQRLTNFCSTRTMVKVTCREWRFSSSSKPSTKKSRKPHQSHISNSTIRQFAHIQHTKIANTFKSSDQEDNPRRYLYEVKMPDNVDHETRLLTSTLLQNSSYS
jgi:hypothetical protein